MGIPTENNCTSSFNDWLICSDYGRGHTPLWELIYNSLMTDRRAEDDQVVQSNNRGGSHHDCQGEVVGSRIWLLLEQGSLNDFLRRSKDYVLEALNWLEERGTAQFEVTTKFEDGQALMTICVTKPDTTSFLFTLNAQRNNENLWVWHYYDEMYS